MTDNSHNYSVIMSSAAVLSLRPEDVDEAYVVVAILHADSLDTHDTGLTTPQTWGKPAAHIWPGFWVSAHRTHINTSH